jgi:hypothetical protein
MFIMPQDLYRVYFFEVFSAQSLWALVLYQ